MSNLSAPYLHNEEAAYDFLEGVMWPTGPVCPHCGGVDRISTIRPNPEKRVRYGLKRCADCKKQFTVKVGTVFEASKVKLHLWLQAVVLVAASKEGISAHQLPRALGVTYKTAWFMCHRIREAMRSGDLAPFGTGGGTVEVDETYIGQDDKPRTNKRGPHHKQKVLSLVDRESGRARSFVVDNMRKTEVLPILRENIAKEATVYTDESTLYTTLSNEFGDHDHVNHRSGEYGRGDVHTNTIEGYFSIFKRGMKGVYQHCAHKHLHRYLAEFDFRYNNRERLGVNDMERTATALRGIVGKRLTYNQPH
mgnify:CR=1 FL=1